jgi:exodeoxyribonuclease VII large subunit
LGSDAYHDVLRTLSESGFAFKLTVHGARVQGRATESSVLNALDWFRARQPHYDAILICRGGGSRTDLQWFDTETLGRAVALFPIPIVSGIGHEQDVSVLDHVARRAKTPTAAAGLVVDAVRASLRHVEDLSASIFAGALSFLDAERGLRRDAARRLGRAVRAFLTVERRDLTRRRDGLGRATLLRLEAARTVLSAAAEGVGPRAMRAIALVGERIDGRARRLHLVDPRRVVERGYAIVRARSGRVVVDPAQAPAGSRLTAELKSGRLTLISEGSER